MKEQKSKQNKGEFPAVHADVNKRLTVAIPPYLVQPLKDYAAKHKTTPSQIVIHALCKVLKIEMQPLHRGRKRGSKNKPIDPLVRQARKLVSSLDAGELARLVGQIVQKEGIFTPDTSAPQEENTPPALTPHESAVMSVPSDEEIMQPGFDRTSLPKDHPLWEDDFGQRKGESVEDASRRMFKEMGYDTD